ncbi:MAG: phosphate ABC transporter substrate-binding protein PstS [Campylobacteraceae bacterium]|nr:phosphate ABC transporter substrate-binding protein PstS [Campylobacteraceae bacterium]
MVKKIISVAAATMIAVSGLSAADKIMGQGATFPMPVYKEWAKLYYKDTKNQVTYSGGGSGKGVSAITDRNGQFGGTDSALKADELAEKKLLQFPAVTGSVVLAYNIKGVEDHALKLDGKAVAGIFSGKITKWNDPYLVKINPGLKLPASDIVPVVRSESSGTTFNFTSYIARADKEWAEKYGAEKTIEWGAKVTPAQGNPLVAKTISQTPNSIGYIEYAYKVQEKLAAATLQSKHGDWVAPTPENFAKAAVNSNFSIEEHFYDVLAYTDGEGSYPIVAATFIVMPSDDVKNGKKVTKFFNWAFTNEGAKKAAEDLGYLPLPAETVEMVNQYWGKYEVSPK